MAEKSAVHPITKESIEEHFTKVNEHMTSVYRGADIPDNLSELVRDIGGDKIITAPEVAKTVEALRQGLGLYYEMYAVLEDKVKATNTGISPQEKDAFLTSYSMFAASSFIENKLELLIADKKPIDVDKNQEFRFDKTKDDVLNGVLARYYSTISIGKRGKILKEGVDLARASTSFFNVLKSAALEKKATFNPKLVDLVKDDQFRIMDEFTVNGFETSHEDRTKTETIEFVRVLPYQVAGNVLAKRELLRDEDRLFLFDLSAKKNPIVDIGGLSPSVLLVGLPGTGKTKIFRMEATRGLMRCEQVNEICWKKKNLLMKYMQVIIDQGVKSEFYSMTGRNVQEKLSITRRPDGIYKVIVDDMDLLAKMSRDNTGGGSSDNDMLNVLMQHLDGIKTVQIGNTQLLAATNDPMGLDPALRQRFIARYEVEGPIEWYDFADILTDEFEKELKAGVLSIPSGNGYIPYEMRKKETGREAGKDSSFLDKIRAKAGGGITMRDIGEYCREIKVKNPRFTGRATHAAAEAIRKIINNYDIPEEWFEKPDLFFEKDWNARVLLIKDLCPKNVTGEMVLSEIQRYAESEQRFASDKFESDVKSRVNEIRVQMEAGERYKGGIKNA